jgi:hypothetical protein
VNGAGEAGLPRGTPSSMEAGLRRVATGGDKVAGGRSPSAQALLVFFGAGEAGLPRGTPSGMEAGLRRVATGGDKVAGGRSPSAQALLVFFEEFGGTLE